MEKKTGSETNRELISIIIPAYNAERYVARCLESCVRQTYEHIEVIVINDGSTDGTERIVKEYTERDSRIKLIESENKGVSSARNLGIDNAKGTYLSFVDADDELEDDAMAVLYGKAKEYGADVTIGNHRFMDEDSGNVSDNDPYSEQLWKGEQALIALLEDHPATYSMCAKLFRKEIIRETRLVTGRKIHEDSYFNFLIFAKKPKVVVCDDYVYIIHNTSGSASRGEFSDKYLDILYFMEQKKAYIRESFPHLSDYLVKMELKADMAFLAVAYRADRNKYKKVIQQCINFVNGNRDAFVPQNEDNKKLFFIITHHMYSIYSVLAKMLHR